jgi:hypothetical protein
VRVNGGGFIFNVLVSSPVGSEKIDIYMDMNHKPMAGVTAFLEDVEGYMEPDDAWEFALRIENGSAYLYRPGGVKHRLVVKLAVTKNGPVVVSKDVIKGNPLKWGYQVVLAVPDASGKFYAVDFLSSENTKRQKSLLSQSVHLRAIRDE